MELEFAVFTREALGFHRIAKPLSSDRGSISLSNLRVLGHEITVGHAHFLLDTPAREGANVVPSGSAGAV